LGLPSPKSVVLWYVLDKKDLQRIVRPQIELCVEGVDHKECVYEKYDDIQHVHLSEYGTGRIEILGLKPDQVYRGRVILLDEAFEFTASTAPEPGNQKPFSFIAYSGFQPYAWQNPDQSPYVYRQTVRILDMLKERAKPTIDSKDNDKSRPAFILGAGDQVYVDNDAHKFKPTALLWGKHSQRIRCSDEYLGECFDEVYRRHFAIPTLDETFRYLPSMMIWDDHEIRDGWGSQGDEKEKDKTNGGYKWANYLNAARGAFVAYQALRNPGLGEFVDQASGEYFWDSINQDAQTRDWIKKEVMYTEDPTKGKELFFSFDWGNTYFFVMDLRSYRYAEEDRVISSNQFKAIEAWLKRMESIATTSPKLLVLVSTMPLLAGRAKGSEFFAEFFKSELADDLVDKWDSTENDDQRQKLLCMFARFLEKNQRTHRVLMITGDIHASEVVYVNTGDPNQVVAHEVVASGLAQTKFDKRGAVYGEINRTHFCDETSKYKSVTTEKAEGPNFVEIYVDPRNAATSEEIDIRVRFYLSSVEGRFVKPKSNPKNGTRTITLEKETPQLTLYRSLWTSIGDFFISIFSPGDRRTYEITTLNDYFEFEDPSQGKDGEEKATSWHDPIYPAPSAKPSSQGQQQTSEELREEVQSQE
jgi:phosphodiesterase/alkaline phosphatase D-like protein